MNESQYTTIISNLINYSQKSPNGDDDFFDEIISKKDLDTFIRVIVNKPLMNFSGAALISLVRKAIDAKWVEAIKKTRQVCENSEYLNSLLHVGLVMKEIDNFLDLRFWEQLSIIITTIKSLSVVLNMLEMSLVTEFDWLLLDDHQWEILAEKFGKSVEEMKSYKELGDLARDL